MKKFKHCKALSQERELPAYAQAGGDGPQSALEIKKAGIVEAGILVRNAQRGKPWFS